MLKRSVFRLILLLLLLLLTLPLHAQDGGLIATTTADVILRAGPGTQWRQLEVLPPGSNLRLDGYGFDGAWVRGITSGSTVGWVASQYLNVTLDQIRALPPVLLETPFTLPPPPPGPGAAAAPAAPAENAAAPAAPVQAAAPAAAGGASAGAVIATTERVNLRQNASSSASVLRLLDANTPLTLLGRDTSGAWIRVITPRGEIGWVSWSLTTFSGSVTNLPIVNNDSAVLFNAPAPNAAPAPAVAQQPAPAEQAGVPPPVASAPLPRGFSFGGHIQSFADSTIAALRQSGMTWVKKQVRWQPGMNPGDFGWMIGTAHSYGFRILLGVVGFNSELNNPGYFEQYASFVSGLAAQGADAIEVWNEPNIDREWTPGQIDPGRYTQLLAAAYNAIKGANPNTMVVSGAPAPTGFFGGCSGVGCDDNLFIAGMAAAGAANYMDCLGIHYNEGILPPTARSGDPRGNSGHYSRYFYGMLDTYWSAFRGARPLCFTELGYLSPEGLGPLPGGFAWASNVTVAQQAAWLDQAVSLSAQSGRVRLLIVWNVDFTFYGEDPMAGYAMIRPGGGCPACEALGR